MTGPDRARPRIIGALAALMMSAAPALADDEIPLVVDPVGAGVWLGEARGSTLEFRRDPAGLLIIRFLGRDGAAVAPPPADRVTLKSPGGGVTTFVASGQAWRATGRTTLEEGALLSISEADHHHDFRLNVHAAGTGGSAGAVKP